MSQSLKPSKVKDTRRRHRRNKEVSNSPNLPEERCHFFKIILDANIRERRLRIPAKFISELRDELSDMAVLKVPSGKVWSIGLRKAEGKVWFDEGWQEFSEYNSILENYFLVFRYDGHSNFYVCIFDPTACEIEYPCDSMVYEENNPKDGSQIEEMEEHSCEEIFDVPPRPSKTTAASRKVMIDESEEQQMTKSKVRSGLSLKQEENKNMPIAQRIVNAKDSVPRKPIMVQEREQLLQAVTAFKSTNPFCTVKMQPSYVSGNFILNVPRRFARTFLSRTHQAVTLRVPDGRRWDVYCCCSLLIGSAKIGSAKIGSAKISRGWNVFALENNLEEGDICIFELVRKSSIELKVYIYRFTEYGAAHQS